MTAHTANYRPSMRWRAFTWVAATVALALVSQACSGGTSKDVTPTTSSVAASSSNPTTEAAGGAVDIGEGVLASARDQEALGLVVSRADGIVPVGVQWASVGATLRIDATAQPSEPVVFKVPFDDPIPPDVVPVALISSTPEGPWEPLETWPSEDRRSAEVHVPHFSFLSMIFAPVKDLLSEVKTIFDDATGGFLAEAQQPTCAGEAEARQRLAIASTLSDGVLWCLGVENGETILRVVNNRRYPLQATHPGLTTIDNGWAWARPELLQLSRIGSGDLELLPVREPVTFRVDDDRASLQTEFNGVAHGLYQLQVGIEVALTLLTKVKKVDKAAEGKKWLDAALVLVTCLTALGELSAGNILSNCVIDEQLADALGRAAIAVVAMIVGPVIEFFNGQVNALADVARSRDNYAIQIGPANPTIDGLRSASIPSICGFPAGQLVDGRLPEPSGPGEVWLGELAAQGDITGGGVAELAVVFGCNGGGVAWPEQIAVVGSGNQFLGVVDTGAAFGDFDVWRAVVIDLTYDGGAFTAQVGLEGDGGTTSQRRVVIRANGSELDISAERSATTSCEGRPVGDNDSEYASDISTTNMSCQQVYDLMDALYLVHSPWSGESFTSAGEFSCEFASVPPSQDGGSSGRYQCASGTSSATWIMTGSE